ncbi:hypothetical protein [Aureivirga sp. CE67]|uniref:hypothetical protein n=1 Tax=Aureivirga sp. CE67 TaxID=1788983 RepID=UPI0018CAD43D|nr:hypothetical protein [Aureivirga sp. CE67]
MKKILNTLKKSFKYLLIVFINFIILYFLFYLSLDAITLKFSSGFSELFELLKLVGISIITLLFLRILIFWFESLKINSLKSRVLFSIVLTLLISSKFYYSYSKDILYRITSEKRTIINSATSKINEHVGGLTFGYKVEKLTIGEYQEIINIKDFPKIQKMAKDISFLYTYDGFLPDYTFKLSYKIPLNVKLDSTEFRHGKITLDTINKNVEVNYLEIEY